MGLRTAEGYPVYVSLKLNMSIWRYPELLLPDAA